MIEVTKAAIEVVEVASPIISDNPIPLRIGFKGTITSQPGFTLVLDKSLDFDTIPFI